MEKKRIQGIKKGNATEKGDPNLIAVIEFWRLGKKVKFNKGSCIG